MWVYVKNLPIEFRKLPTEEQLFYFLYLGWYCEQSRAGKECSIAMAAWDLRMEESTVLVYIQELVGLGMLEKDASPLVSLPKKSNERVKKHREKMKRVTKHVTQHVTQQLQEKKKKDQKENKDILYIKPPLSPKGGNEEDDIYINSSQKDEPTQLFNSMLELKNKKNAAAASGEEEPKVIRLEREFKKFWAAYPKKAHYQMAWTAWQQIQPDIDAVLAAIAQYQSTPAWMEQAGRYVPRADKFIYDHHWTPVEKVVVACEKTPDMSVHVEEEYGQRASAADWEAWSHG
mgnify:CR=1 FL=1